MERGGERHSLAPPGSKEPGQVKLINLDNVFGIHSEKIKNDFCVLSMKKENSV